MSDSFEKMIHVRKSPELDFTVEDVCQGQLVSIVNESDSLSVSLETWQWDFGDGNISEEKDPKYHGYISPGTYDIELNVQATNGCVSTLVKPVRVIESPNTAISVDGDPCNNSDLVLEVDNNPDFTYQWYLDDVRLNTETGYYLIPTSEGNYTVEISSLCGVKSFEYNLLKLQGLPKPDILAQGPVVWYLACSNDTADIYNWYYNGTQIDGAHEYLYVANNILGDYQVEIGNVDSECLVRSEIISIPILSVDKESYASGIVTIYPNPTSGMLYFEMENILRSDLIIKLVASDGSQLLQKSIEKSSNTLIDRLDLSEFTPGLYLIQFNIGGSSHAERIIIEK